MDRIGGTLRLTFRELWEKLCTGDESVEIEAKRASNIGTSIHETISAFANEPGRDGGYLLLGVCLKAEALFGDYEVVGVANPDRMQTDLATICRQIFNVAVRPTITVEQHDDKNVIVVFVPEAPPADKPTYIKKKGLPHGAFRRIGSSTQHCTEDDIALFYQLREHRTFDETPVADVGLDGFDPGAVEEYRRLRAKIQPEAAELDLSDEELLYALHAISSHDGRTCATIAGLMLFGKRMVLRRHFPMARIDYIRVEGREWVPDPEHRYEAIETIGPLVRVIPAVVAQVLGDVPKAFSLPEGGIHREDIPVIPRTVIREAVVNAAMHRNYRMRQPVQIIRYANRLEIRNPGHSLVPDDRLGTPGSLTRNEKIAAVLHEIGLAETKGTGIRAMREAMDRANLTLPVFESDRMKDTFMVVILAHHLLDQYDVEWLGSFKGCNLTEDEARALIWVREYGAISNTAYRNINHMDTLTASGHLRRLRDLGLLDQRGKGPGTYYLPTPHLTGSQPPASAAGHPSKGTPVISSQSPEGTPVISSQSPGGTPVISGRSPGLEDAPQGLAEAIEGLGQRAPPADVKEVIRGLCEWKALSAEQIAKVLGRDKDYVTRTYLRSMVQGGTLEYTNPVSPAHPRQAYRTARDDAIKEP